MSFAIAPPMVTAVVPGKTKGSQAPGSDSVSFAIWPNVTPGSQVSVPSARSKLNIFAISRVTMSAPPSFKQTSPSDCPAPNGSSFKCGGAARIRDRQSASVRATPTSCRYR